MQESIITSFPKCHSTPQVSCSQCRLNTLCLPIALHVEEIEKVDNIIQRGRPLHKGEFLFHDEDAFTAVYAVRSGCIKTVSISGEGQEQVTGFYLPGEILGMDGIAQGKHTNSAIALETSAICEIPFSHLENLSTEIPSLQRHVFQILGKEIAIDQQLITLLSKNSADERVATLLLSISSRNNRRNLSATHFRLPMSRAEIGNYLGLTVETVSRVLSRLQKNHLITADKKEITLLDLAKLRDLAQGVSNEEI
ncbi:MAG: fumarate/nitrate reduction transcriptional regulator Fnr [Cellvibrionaceae bacterium]